MPDAGQFAKRWLTRSHLTSSGRVIAPLCSTEMLTIRTWPTLSILTALPFFT